MIAVLAALATLYRFPPGRYPVYPACPFHTLTGLDCPGCGSTRALAALLHGHVAQAWHFNALFTLLVIPAAVYLLPPLVRGRMPRALPAPVVATLLIAATIFTVGRNLPG